jgi:hypothetical protein
MSLLLLLAGRSAIELLRIGLGAEVASLTALPYPAIAVLPLSLLMAILIGRRIRRQLSVRFDGFGIHFRRRLEARVLPWRTITRITPEPHWYGDNIRVDSESATLTIAGAYYQSQDILLAFVESQRRYHASIEARLATHHTTTRPPAAI